MRKNIIFRLSFLMVSLVTVYSCRNDYLPDHTEVYNDNSKFQLTSKTISLSESKHKAQLIPKLEKAESEIKKIQKSYSGKTVQYGNGISIDTDQVIYIENGPNYHTYTFNINRENAGTDAPVENLLLSPLPDGSYREFLVTYYLTEQEKQIIRSGNTISIKGKSEIVELSKGSFGNPLGKESCGYETVDVYIPCGTGEHHAGNVGSWGGCKWQKEGFAGPKHYSLVAYVCTGSPDDPGTSNPGTGSGGGGGSGSSGGGGNNNPPCEVRPPLTPKPGLTDENGCPIGNPTQPNLPNPKDPCEKAKTPVNNVNNILHATTISSEINALKGYAANNHYEYGSAIVSTGSSIIAQDPYSNNNSEDPGSVSIIVPSIGDYLAAAHTHPRLPPPSVRDLYSTLGYAKNYPTFQASYIVTKDGTIYAFVITDREKALAFLTAYPFSDNTTDEGRIFNIKNTVGIDFNEIYNNYMTGRLLPYSGPENEQNDGLESALAYVLDKYDLGITIAKTDSKGDLKPLRPISFEYIIPSSGGKKIIGYKARLCP